jgi:hypothetical protein
VSISFDWMRCVWGLGLRLMLVKSSRRTWIPESWRRFNASSGDCVGSAWSTKIVLIPSWWKRGMSLRSSGSQDGLRGSM